MATVPAVGALGDTDPGWLVEDLAAWLKIPTKDVNDLIADGSLHLTWYPWLLSMRVSEASVEAWMLGRRVRPKED